MRHLFLLLSLLSVVSYLFGQAPSISGHWRRLGIQQTQVYSNSQQQYGDLIIGTDSSFTIVGNVVAQKSTMPGWNAGGTMHGRWEVSGKRYLYLYDSVLNIPLAYRIRRLTKGELHLQSSFKK